ncbi:uncharacterized protein LOC124263699 [Haliotis rubra]|uniref:uncharacterized protein LOC124263699 n=1 Tax=Haliotis rubra TaxID=36100 RepID=UPI001EE51A62|nr:uncharacterized protein LOC124263699 [Haliotis rubra]
MCPLVNVMTEVLVKDESQLCFKVRHVADADAMDVWVKKDEVLTKVVKSTVEDRVSSFVSKCVVQIKKTLCLQNRNKRVVRITVDVDQDIYKSVFGHVGSDVMVNGTKYTIVPDNSELEQYFGAGWNLRMLNRRGDFMFVVPGTFKACLKSHAPVKEFVPSSAGLIEKWMWQGLFCELVFVPEFGTGPDYFHLMWYSLDTLV